MRGLRSALLIVALAAAAPAMAQAQKGEIEARATEAIHDFIAAVTSNNTGQLGPLLAPEFQILRADGSTYDRAGYLASQLPIIAAVPDVQNLTVTATGNTVVTTFTVDINQTRDGVVVESFAPRLAVFRIEGDAWLMVAYGNFAALEQ